ncbi:hypothetical protein [Kosmotoga sp. DU53]|uniref:hypothetical protein n=1 Tax=Kosmotoga sp. DU53 TaxID=1310160 RepID=UPI0002EA5030|nr:hypothetical protein [Kosmotoga sp. DU53]
MERVRLITRVPPEKIGHKFLRSGAKVFLSNPNIYCRPIWSLETNVGTIREAFFVSQFSSYSIAVPDIGDFSIRFNGKRIVFEIGGPGKTLQQIKNEENAFVLKDGVESGYSQVIPLYLIGMMY